MRVVESVSDPRVVRGARARALVGALAICALALAESASSSGTATTAKIRYLGGSLGTVEFTIRGVPECAEYLSGGKQVAISMRRGSRVVGRTNWDGCKDVFTDPGYPDIVSYPEWDDLDRPGQWVSVGFENSTHLSPDMRRSGRYPYSYLVTIDGRRALAGKLVVTTTAKRIYKGTDAFQNYCKNQRRTIYSYKGRLFCWRITYRTVPA